MGSKTTEFQATDEWNLTRKDLDMANKKETLEKDRSLS